MILFVSRYPGTQFGTHLYCRGQDEPIRQIWCSTEKVYSVKQPRKPCVLCDETGF